MADILIIDDDSGVLRTISRIIEEEGLASDSALTLTDGLFKARSGLYDVIFLDVRLPDGSGLEIMNELTRLPSSPQVIIMTAFSDPDGAETAIERGAWDYIRKPASSNDIRLQLRRALQYQKQRRRSKEHEKIRSTEIIGSSQPIEQCLKLAAHIARSDANVLLTGETGTGKELFAKAIHENSRRRNKSFIVVDCSVLSKNLIENTLFGHKKGAYTGADKNQRGLVSLANGGTLFLDEVGELPMSIQASFLRVLQEKKFRPVGSDEEILSNFRVISATNKDIGHMAEQNQFRKDLLYRLKSFSLELPPLRERAGDIEEITRFYLKKYCNQYEMESKVLSGDFIESLEKYAWPGNVRELVNTVDTCILSTPDQRKLFSYHLPQKMRIQIAKSTIEPGMNYTAVVNSNDSTGQILFSHKEMIEREERRYFSFILEHTRGNIREMCSITGISRAGLYRKLKKYNIRLS